MCFTVPPGVLIDRGRYKSNSSVMEPYLCVASCASPFAARRGSPDAWVLLHSQSRGQVASKAPPPPPPPPCRGRHPWEPSYRHSFSGLDGVKRLPRFGGAARSLEYASRRHALRPQCPDPGLGRVALGSKTTRNRLGVSPWVSSSGPLQDVGYRGRPWPARTRMSFCLLFWKRSCLSGPLRDRPDGVETSAPQPKLEAERLGIVQIRGSSAQPKHVWSKFVRPWTTPSVDLLQRVAPGTPSSREDSGGIGIGAC